MIVFYFMKHYVVISQIYLFFFYIDYFYALIPSFILLIILNTIIYNFRLFCNLILLVTSLCVCMSMCVCVCAHACACVCMRACWLSLLVGCFLMSFIFFSCESVRTLAFPVEILCDLVKGHAFLWRFEFPAA